MLDYFELVKVKHSSTLIELSLDEVYPSFYREYPDIESKGIMAPTPSQAFLFVIINFFFMFVATGG